MRNEQGATKSLGMVAMDQLPELDGWWLWPQRIPMGNLTLLTGDQDAGKSRVAWDLAARVSRGDVWPDGEVNPMGAGSVLLVSGENHLQIAARPALQAAGADMAKIVCAGSVHEKGKDGKKSKRPFDLRRYFDALEALIVEMKDCRMLIIDSISSYLGSGGGAKTAEILRELMELAVRYQLAVVGVTHLRKGNGEAIHRVVGGLKLTTAARCIWAVAAARESRGGRRLMLPVKNNLAAGVLGLAFWLRQYEGQKAPWVDWSADAVEATADEAFAMVRASLKEQPKAVQEAMEFLKAVLRDGPRLVKELEAEAKKQGISQITLRRARVALEVRKYREVIPGPWSVRLAEVGGQRSEAREDRREMDKPCENEDHVDHLGENAEFFAEVSADHVDHVAENAEEFEVHAEILEDHAEHVVEKTGVFTVMGQDGVQDDPLLCGACCGDGHETGSIGKLSVLGRRHGRRERRNVGVPADDFQPLRLSGKA